MSQMDKSTKKTSNLVDVGRISTVYGVNGWLKIQSGTEPEESLFGYKPWWLKTKHGVKAVEVLEYKAHGKGWVAHIDGVDDRDQAQTLTSVVIAVERAQMPELDVGEYYWHQLIGLAVITEFEGGSQRLGTVQRLLETGANDVLVVQGDAESLDQSERLIPYVPDVFVRQVDLEHDIIVVEWDPAF